MPAYAAAAAAAACVTLLVQELHLYLDFKSDESYTPSRLAVRAGSTHHDLKVQSAAGHAALQCRCASIASSCLALICKH
jgi:hypothetical protein